MRGNKGIKVFVGLLCLVMFSSFGCVRTSSTVVVSGVETTENDNKKKKENGQFEIVTEFGLNGVIKARTAMPVNLSIKNKGENFSGVVRIIIPEASDSRNGIAYEKSLTLAENTEKIVILTIPNSTSSGQFYVEIETDKGEVLTTEKIRTGYTGSVRTSLVGVLSDSVSDLNALDNIDIYDGSQYTYTYGDPIRTQLVELNETILPEDPTGLECLTFLVVNDYSIEKLNNEQIKAITNWVDQGGILVLGTGSHYKKVLSQFPEDFISGDIGDLSKEKVSYGQTTAMLDCIDVNVKDSTPLLKATKGVIVNKVKRGEGAIAVVPFDLGASDFLSWKQHDEVMKAILRETTGKTADEFLMSEDLQYGADENATWVLKNALDFYRDIEIPNTMFFAALFVVYILLIGPVGYLILKRMDKREYIWYIVPLGAIICFGTVMIFSYKSQIKQPVATTLTIAELGDTQNSNEVYIGLLSPSGSPYNIKLAKECQNYDDYSVVNGYYYSSAASPDNYKYEYAVNVSNDGYEFKLQKNKAFSTQTLGFQYTDVNKTGQFDTKLTGGMKSISGEVTNNSGYHLKDAVLIYNDLYVYIGSFKNGETKKIKETDVSALLNMDLYSIGNTLLGTDPYSGAMDESQMEKQYTADTYTFFLLRNYTDTNNDMGYILGMQESIKKDYVLNNNVTEVSRGMICQKVESDNQNTGEFFIRNMNSKYINYDYKQNVDYMANTIYQGNEAEIRYGLPENYNAAILTRDDTLFNGIIEAYNVKAKKYEPIFTDSSKLELPALSDYISEENYIKIKYIIASNSNNSEGQNPQQIPILSMEGRIK